MTEFDVYTRVSPYSPEVQHLMDLIKYEYIGMFGSPDPNPLGGLASAQSPVGSVILVRAKSRAVAVCGVSLDGPGSQAVLRRMFTVWEFRRRGIARQLLAAAESEARRLGSEKLLLETEAAAALALYFAEGYTPTEPFGYYANAETSVFLEKIL